MMLANFDLRLRRAALATVLAISCAVPSLRAEEALRWKFSPGETMQVSFQQTAHTETVGGGVPTSIAVVMGMDMTWRIEEVTADGTATMSQAFDRLTVSMKTGEFASVDYDSASEPSSAPAKEIAAKIGPLIGPKFRLRMTNRGEILEVKLAEAAIADKAEGGLKSLFSPEGISRVLRQSVVVQLPEQPLASGDEWTSTNSVESPLGLLEQVNVYKYIGSVDRDGRRLEQIKVESELKVGPEAARAKTSIKSQSQIGELWFDRAQGRLVSSLITQKLTTARRYGDSQIEVRSTAKLTATFK